MPKKKTKAEKIKAIAKDWENMAYKTVDKAIKDLNKIGRLAVWEWYRSYRPKIYHRKKTLYYGFKVTGEKGRIQISFGPEEMYHVHYVDKIDPTYVFENSFMGGFHGGATYGENHPDPGVPYWRTPPPNYPYWSFPAAHDVSPYLRINSAFDDYETKISNRLADKFEKRIYFKLLQIINS